MNENKQIDGTWMETATVDENTSLLFAWIGSEHRSKIILVRSIKGGLWYIIVIMVDYIWLSLWSIMVDYSIRHHGWLFDYTSHWQLWSKVHGSEITAYCPFVYLWITSFFCFRWLELKSLRPLSEVFILEISELTWADQFAIPILSILHFYWPV